MWTPSRFANSCCVRARFLRVLLIRCLTVALEGLRAGSLCRILAPVDAQNGRRKTKTQQIASNSSRAFRSFLLVQQFEAREIGARIKQARKEMGLTQEELAEITSVSKRSLQDYENGVTLPYRHLRELGKLLGKDVEWFLHGDDEVEEEDRLAAIEKELQAVQRELAAVREAQLPVEDALALAHDLRAALQVLAARG